MQAPIRCVIYADTRSMVEMSNLQGAALTRELTRFFGAGVNIVSATSEDVQSGKAFADNPHIFILPGIKGERSYYPEHIGPAGNAHIRRFVEQGGVFLGFCAGAYYAASRILYEPGWGETRERPDGNLALFNGMAHGPAAGFCRSTQNNTLLSHEAQISHVDPIRVLVCDGDMAGQSLNLAYGLGPIFALKGKQRNVNVIARYDTLAGKPPAVLDVRVGRGRAILSGVLPQFGQDHDPAPMRSTVPATLANLMERLYEDRDKRQAFWDSLMDRISSHHCFQFNGLSVS